jgi:hypothetical protein
VEGREREAENEVWIDRGVDTRVFVEELGAHGDKSIHYEKRAVYKFEMVDLKSSIEVAFR